MAAIAVAVAAGMSYPEWFRAQVVEAAMVHGLTYAKVGRLYGVSDDNVRKWVNAASDAPGGLDRLEELEHRIARIEQYLALAEAIREQGVWAVGRGSSRALETMARQSFETLRPLWERTEGKDEE